MCVQPIILKNKQIGKGANLLTTPVPCGRCPQCVKSKINSWTLRIEKELERSSRPLFITLTYNDENLPYKNGNPTLQKRDIQLFMKRLRKQHSKVSKEKLVYYACGEYGTKRGRPHYHMILLNLHGSVGISSSWQLGFDYTVPAEIGSIGYVLKYMSKQRQKSNKEQKNPEFSLMSKGIGSNYLTDRIKRYHTENLENCYYIKSDGIKLSLPKYYKDKIYDEQQRASTTSILKRRSEQKEAETLAYLLKKSKNPELNLEIRKKHLTFDKRNTEVF